MVITEIDEDEKSYWKKLSRKGFDQRDYLGQK